VETQGRRPWLVDVHNHVMPAEVLDLLRREPAYGVRIEGNRWVGGHHVPFTIETSFHDPVAKLAELDSYEIASAVVSPTPAL